MRLAWTIAAIGMLGCGGAAATENLWSNPATESLSRSTPGITTVTRTIPAREGDSFTLTATGTWIATAGRPGMALEILFLDAGGAQLQGAMQFGPFPGAPPTTVTRRSHPAPAGTVSAALVLWLATELDGAAEVRFDSIDARGGT